MRQARAIAATFLGVGLAVCGLGLLLLQSWVAEIDDEARNARP